MIPTQGPGATFGVIAYLAIVAYPDGTEKEKLHRDKLVKALKARLSKEAIAKGLPREKVRPELRAMDNREIDRQIRKGLRRLGWRLQAARVAMEMILWSDPRLGRVLAAAMLEPMRLKYGNRIFKNVTFAVPSSRKMATIERIIGPRPAAAIHVTDPRDRLRNFRKNKLDSSWPVLPLAMALRSVLLEAGAQNGVMSGQASRRRWIDVMYLVKHPDWVVKALAVADFNGRLLAVHGNIGRSPGEFIRLMSANDPVAVTRAADHARAPRSRPAPPGDGDQRRRRRAGAGK
ncbi:hypothetical protein HY633_01300 [Candidatus Uhrbacteria bacterium]|nr:hypothetical protein [Candidatus Uhrbacteria bacterium]